MTSTSDIPLKTQGQYLATPGTITDTATVPSLASASPTVPGVQHRLGVQGQGGQVRALARRRTIRQSRPRRPDRTTRAQAANRLRKCFWQALPRPA